METIVLIYQFKVEDSQTIIFSSTESQRLG